MPTKKPHFSIVMDDSLLKIVEEFQTQHNIKSRGKAISMLLQAGVAAVLGENKKAAPSDIADRAAGEADIVRILSRALIRLGVIQTGEDLSDKDRRFLEAMFTATKAHFQK